MTDPVLVDVLNELEARELPLLSWGVTSGAYGEVELLDLLASVRPEDEPEDLLERLLASGLVFERGVAGNQFRTRMAETVRLARHLRQWFHGPRSDWRSAKTLVSDMRFLSRPRVVPVRQVDERELIARLRANLSETWTAAHEENLKAVLGGQSLSEFQVRATARLLGSVGSRGGTCITAGTGAGKTLAFYLPALTHALSVPAPAGIPRIVAIYPRIELLRDQLAAILKSVTNLEASDVGHLQVGVLYKEAPKNQNDARQDQRKGWTATAEGLISPIVSCPRDGCSGKLLWPNSEKEGRRLRCITCGSELESLVFTRRSLKARPPEILFTTTEMVNRSLGAPEMQRLLVGDSRRSPDFVLLDEIHTYSGTHGAQVANLLRRWRGEMAAPSHVVGLSATLADPKGFFSELVGADTGSVAVVAPSDAEMRDLGREYFMALRGDPASQTSLLSTTIQAAMLMRRMLDREPDVPSGGMFGNRLFAFTDNLDIVNRLHSQLQDAEGWRPGGVDRKPEGSLAVLRASGGDNGPRDDVGQLWDAAEELGTLTLPMVIDRTTSQDSGVDRSSDIVVATASLEVGFDDPNVGAVLQHKAPRDAAQFLQRRGRAGRNPVMRPWTTVVLSDYGRDRLAFQAYETLFDPRVQPTRLPIRNRVILKMQATWWLTDYLRRRSGGAPLLDVLKSEWQRDSDRQVRAANKALRAARSLLTAEGIDRLRSGLQWSLRISEEDARSVLFDHPRAIATTVLPTIIRRLEAVLGQDRLPDDFPWGDPLVDFVPNALFAPLQTPEVRIHPPPRGEFQPEPYIEPIAQSMREFAPGKVSYRFAIRGKDQRMWVNPPASIEPHLDLEDFCSNFLQLTRPPGLQEPVVQPRAIQLSRPSTHVLDSSYGRWNWEVFFRINGTPVELDVPYGSPWAGRVQSVAVMTHRVRAPLTVWRIARTVEVERQVRSGSSSTQHRVRLAGRDAAVGFAMEVDGIRIDVSLPEHPVPQAGTRLDRALRTTYFEHLVLTDSTLANRVPSSFLREWLAQFALCAVVTASVEVGSGLAQLSDEELPAAMVQAARAVFGAEGPPDDPTQPVQEPGLVADVENALRDGVVVTAVQRCLASLRGPLPLASLSWVHERYASTIAAGFIGAVQATCPDLGVDDLRADFELLSSDDDQPFARIMVSEDQPGGTGVIETAVERITEDPRAFWTVVASVLGPCDGERIDQALRRFLRDRHAGYFANGVDQIRAASTLGATTTAWSLLREMMFQRGIDADQTTIGALATRLLRPGSDALVEQLCRDLLSRWDAIEDELGVEVDLRVLAYIAAQHDDTRRSLTAITSHLDQDSGWTVGQVVGLLWSRGSKLRASSLQTYNPYRKPPDTERLLVEPITRAPIPTVQFGAVGWRADLDSQLSLGGVAQITCSNEPEAVDALHQLLTVPTAVHVLEFHPRVIGVERSSAKITLTVDLREAQQ
ncbi:MAG: DEAD/DEAH box helicase [Acidimicrobiaceae bacterium]|nr:DEAD/DEAH box helicase [Acidimicrobiaceae bacterium]MYE08235.1 DEAD/DEAH box helicase [Acidimicrobiaceae bacterium]MYI36028.1 DEAD/DEAH box helicase [Acidimicrobiaceae bacterium]